MATKEEVEAMNKQEREANSIAGAFGLLKTFLPAMPPDEAATASVLVDIAGGLVTDINRIANALEAANYKTNGGFLTDEETKVIEALRNGSAVVQPATRRHM